MCNLAQWICKDVLRITSQNKHSGSFTSGWFLKLFDTLEYDLFHWGKPKYRPSNRILPIHSLHLLKKKKRLTKYPWYLKEQINQNHLKLCSPFMASFSPPSLSLIISNFPSLPFIINDWNSSPFSKIAKFSPTYFSRILTLTLSTIYMQVFENINILTIREVPSPL